MKEEIMTDEEEATAFTTKFRKSFRSSIRKSAELKIRQEETAQWEQNFWVRYLDIFLYNKYKYISNTIMIVLEKLLYGN